MAIELVNTPDAPAAIGPYSQAVRAGGFLFLSGQLPIEARSGELKLFDGDAAQQAALVLVNIEAILKSRGLRMQNVVKTTIFLQSMNDFAKVNEVYARVFGDHRPARSTIEVAKLPKDAAVEIETVACF